MKNKTNQAGMKELPQKSCWLKFFKSWAHAAPWNRVKIIISSPSWYWSSKHLKGQLDPPVGNVTFVFIKGGQLDPPVCDVTFFGSKEVSWILLLVNVPEMQKKEFQNYKNAVA